MSEQPTLEELIAPYSAKADEYGVLTDEKNAKIKEAQKITDPEKRREAMEKIRIDFQQKVKAMMGS